MAFTITTGSPEETGALGCRLGGLLRPGDVVFLRGGLGAGKTCLARGIAAGMGVDNARSPSFALLHRYLTKASYPLYHADLYRLTEAVEAEVLDLSAAAAEGVLIIEWPELVAEEFPEHLAVSMAPDPERDEARRLTIEGCGERYEGLLREMNGLADAGV